MVVVAHKMEKLFLTTTSANDHFRRGLVGLLILKDTGKDTGSYCIANTAQKS